MNGRRSILILKIIFLQCTNCVGGKQERFAQRETSDRRGGQGTRQRNEGFLPGDIGKREPGDYHLTWNF